MRCTHLLPAWSSLAWPLCETVGAVGPSEPPLLLSSGGLEDGMDTQLGFLFHDVLTHATSFPQLLPVGLSHPRGQRGPPRLPQVNSSAPTTCSRSSGFGPFSLPWRQSPPQPFCHEAAEGQQLSTAHRYEDCAPASCRVTSPEARTTPCEPLCPQSTGHSPAERRNCCI